MSAPATVSVSLPPDSRPATFGQRVWKFFNTSLGVWVLSTLLVGGATYVYTNYRLYREAQAARAERLARLNLEVEGRLSQFLSNVADEAISSDPDVHDVTMKPETKLSEDWTELTRPPRRNTKIFGIYPEFADTPTVGLIAEIQRLEPTERRESLRMAAVTLTGNPFAANPIAFTPTWKKLADRVQLPEWNTAMPYVDCPATTPFC